MGEQDRLAAVFVHGFASKAATWRNFDERISEDDELQSVDVLHLEYSTHVPRSLFWRPDRRLPTLSTIADVLQTFLETEAAGYRRLVLVCHSMGGLVVQRYLQRMLNQGRGAELERIRRVVLFATPNAGSDFARQLRRDLLGSHPQERDLRTLNEEIRDTHAAVIRDVVNAKIVGERTCPIPFSVYAGAEDNIVPRASAQGSFPEVGALPGDHFTIIKPTSRHHRSYATLRRLLLETAADSDPPIQQAVTVNTQIDDQAHRSLYQANPSTVIVSELRTDFHGTQWESVYHSVREQLSSASISVVDKWNYPDAPVDVLITVRSADAVLQENSSTQGTVLKVYAEHVRSGGKIFVGICAVGARWPEAKTVIIEWLPADIEGSFYVEGVPDAIQLYTIMTTWIQAAIKRKSVHMRDGSRIDRVLDLAPDPYDIPGRKPL
ncbi:alpha/beta fold hydrolase [Streptomyces sp. TRM S81-3]|uniref:Alpha/beta fold hydrolase n=1 Tax=Streptomyces griseicoloratus TaxID=2752516 RepID=A0A926L980_9ACTN|nr:alpha/beta fold hydrolase [Streptomyces griseicoloratus]